MVPTKEGFHCIHLLYFMVDYCIVQAVIVHFTGVVMPLLPSAELQIFGVIIVGPVFSDDSTEPAPTPLKVAAMFRQGNRAVQPVPLKLPTVKLPHW